MKYRVNNACIGCGFCASTCPEIFEMNDDHRAVAKAGIVALFDAGIEGVAVQMGD